MHDRDKNKKFPSGFSKDFVRVEARTKFYVPKDGTFKFYIGADDGIRIKVDGKQVGNFWRTGSYSVRTGSTFLTKGTHDAFVECY